MTVLVAVVSGCSVGPPECSYGAASCAGLVEVLGEPWTTWGTHRRIDRDLVGEPVAAMEVLCPSVMTCDGVSRTNGPAERAVELRRVEGIPADELLVLVEGGRYAFYVPGTGNVGDPAPEDLSPEVRRLVIRR